MIKNVLQVVWFFVTTGSVIRKYLKPADINNFELSRNP